MNRHFILFALAFAAALSGVAKTFDVDISTGRPAASNEAYYHGETIEFRAVRGRSVVTNIEYGCIYYQTNGMGDAWWKTDGLVFHPTNDIGAASYRFFLEGRDDLGRDWHANGLLRLLDSPGFKPNTLPLPVLKLDFSKVEVLNPPWTDRTTTNDVCNIVTNTIPEWDVTVLRTWEREGFFDQDIASVEYSPWAGNLIIEVGHDTCFLFVTNGAAWPTSDVYAGLAVDSGDGIGFATVELRRNKFRNALGLVRIEDLPETQEESDPTVPSWAKAAQKPTYNASEVGAYPNTSGEQLSAQVSAIGAHLNAEDARFVSTNYDSVVHVPEAYVEVRLTDHGTNVWTTIWREMTRWGKFVGSAFDWNAWDGFHAWATNVTAQLSFKADRCWGIYDSETGGYSPEGYTQISSSNILIAAGMAYQRTVTTGGAVWVLQCNQGTAHIGGNTNGFFRVVDGDGVTQFEIVKGDRREMGADASGITVSSGSVMTIPYSVEAAEHPTIQCCNNITTANWKAETDADCLCTVSWSGSSGAWVATVTPKTAQPQIFVKATFMAGGETYIRNVAPVSMDSIMLNGTKYYLGTATVSGHTVLTLSTTAP